MDKQQTVYLTKEALQNLKEELHFLRTTERARISNAIAVARDHGDLSENAEYDAAKEAQGKLEARIAEDEARKEAVTARLADPEVYADPEKVQSVQAEEAAIEAEIGAGYEEWERLSESLADLEDA